MKKRFFDKLEIFIDKIENFLMKFISNKYIWYLFSLIVIFIVYFYDYRIKTKDLSGKNYNNIFLITALIITAIIVGLLIFNKKIKDLAKKYLIVALILGTIFTFVSPVFTQSDESFHFIRAYQVSSFHFISPEKNNQSYDYFPKSLYKALYDDDDRYPEFKRYDDIPNQLKIELNKNDKIEKDVRASNYIFLNYIPQAIGIGIGRILNLSPYLIGLLGRIFNMVICTFIIYLGLKIIPICKKTMIILLLSPSVIAYNASMSADGLVVAMSFLLISLVLYCIYKKPKFNIKWYLLFLIIISFVSTCKTAYLPLIGIMFFIPNECYNSKKQRWLSNTLFIIYGVLSSLIWLSISRVPLGMDSDYTGIMKYINFIKVFFYTFMNEFVSYIQNVFCGNYLYQTKVRPFLVIPSTYFIIFLLSFFNEENKDIKIKKIHKIIVSAIIVLVVALIAYALYIGNTAKNSSLINGIQGRYFVPVLLLIPFFVEKRRMKTNENIIFNISLILNYCVLLTMINAFI